MATCPFAVQRLIPPGSNDPAITPRVAILHVADSGAPSLWDYFARRSGGIESHFYITWTGKIEQYRDTEWQADANYLANGFAVSIETQGFAGGTWNRRQLRAIKRLLLWLHDTHEIPLRQVRRWDGSGVGYHTLFGAPSSWTPVAKSCPGVRRKVQFVDVLVPWMNAVRLDAIRAAAADSTQVELFRRTVREALTIIDSVRPRPEVEAMYEGVVKALREGPKE